jgi:putative intracellular protease/amidase
MVTNNSGCTNGTQTRRQLGRMATAASGMAAAKTSVSGGAKPLAAQRPQIGDGFTTSTVRPVAAPSVEDSVRRLALQRATALHQAFDAGDAKKALGLLRGGTAESNAALMEAYASRFGRDLEYDMRGFAIDLKGPLDFRGLSLTLRGLKGADLQEGFRLLHGPRLEANATRIAQLIEASPASTPQGRQEIYAMLARAGGEERALLGELFQRQTGKDLVSTLKPVFEAAAADNNRMPPSSPPEKTVAIVVSSGNWEKMLSGEDSKHIGGYHWREIEAYVKEALDRGFTPVIFTPEGLPPSPDAASLLLGKLGPQVGFGLAAGTGPDSPQGRAIVEGFASPRSLKDFDPSQFAAIHVAGGHGSHHDLVGNPLVESAAVRMHEQGKIVTAVCHASPSLGKLLQGGPATGFSPQIDAFMMKAGFVLPEFHPPYDAHQGLVDIGVDFSFIDRMQSLTNIHHTETYLKNGVPVVTGTGPEATDDVARIAFDWLQDEHRKTAAAWG